MEATLHVDEPGMGWGKGWNRRGESICCPNKRRGCLDEVGDAENEQKRPDLILVSGVMLINMNYFFLLPHPYPCQLEVFDPFWIHHLRGIRNNLLFSLCLFFSPKAQAQ